MSDSEVSETPTEVYEPGDATSKPSMGEDTPEEQEEETEGDQDDDETILPTLTRVTVVPLKDKELVRYPLSGTFEHSHVKKAFAWNCMSWKTVYQQ